jgi:hypothetical protein
MVSSVIISERAVRGVLKTLPVYHKTVSARTEKHHIAPNGAKNLGYLGAGIAFQGRKCYNKNTYLHPAALGAPKLQIEFKGAI